MVSPRQRTVTLLSVLVLAGAGAGVTAGAGTAAAAGPACAGGAAATSPAATAALARTLTAGSTPAQRKAWSALPVAERQRKLDGFRAAVSPAVRAAVAAHAPAPPPAATPWRQAVAGTAAARGAVDPRFTRRAPAARPRLSPTGQDQDGDGLDDGVENDVADAFTPLYHPSAAESAGTGFATFGDFVPETATQVLPVVPPFSYFRVQPLGAATETNGTVVGVLRLDYLTLWNRDDGLEVGGGCEVGLAITLGLIGLGAGAILDGLAGHRLDNERSAALVAAPLVGGGYNTDPNAYAGFSYYTAAHEGTFTDHSAYLTPTSPVPAYYHLNLALSRSKHGTYTFNPDGLPLIPDWVPASVSSTLDFLLADGEISFDDYVWYQGIAYTVFYQCFVEQFLDQGGFYAASRVNVGEPNQPVNGSHFIQDPELYQKLTTPLW